MVYSIADKPTVKSVLKNNALLEFAVKSLINGYQKAGVGGDREREKDSVWAQIKDRSHGLRDGYKTTIKSVSH